MKGFIYCSVILLLFIFSTQKSEAQTPIDEEKNDFVKLSMQLLSSVKNNSGQEQFIQAYKDLSLDKLGDALRSDQEIKAFWINTYNAYVQILLIENPKLFEDRGDFFKMDRVNIGGQMFSFDFIEHGIIRGSKVKLSMGFLKDPFAGELEKKFRVEETDGRVHFALNCGARSCPYIAIFSSVNLDNELDAIAEQFLKRTTIFKEEKGEVYVTTLFSWFKGDFSDKGGVLGFLKLYAVIPSNVDPKVSYKDYDWSLDLGNYTELSIYK